MYLDNFTKSKKKHMLKISAVYLIGKAEIPIHYTTWGQVEQALLMITLISSKMLGGYKIMKNTMSNAKRTS